MEDELENMLPCRGAEELLSLSGTDDDDDDDVKDDDDGGDGGDDDDEHGDDDNDVVPGILRALTSSGGAHNLEGLDRVKGMSAKEPSMSKTLSGEHSG